MNDEDAVGFKDVKETLRGKLVGGPHELDIISIVSMPGSGKTTLARMISQLSLISISEQSVVFLRNLLIGKIKACRVHDLVLDFCKEKAEEENLLLWLKRDHPGFYSNSDGDRRVRWSTSCSGARSILFREVSDNTFAVMKNASDIFGSFNFLRVLDLESVIVYSIPIELRNLRYFAVRIAKHCIPSSIDSLSNLETFQVKGMKEEVTLPYTFWKLVKLRHVHISNIALFRCPYDSGRLENLATLSSPYFSSAGDMERVVRRTPNLKKLRCVLDKSWGRGKKGRRFPVLDSLTQLETLKILFFHVPKIIPTRLNFPLSLTKVSLCNFPLEFAGISTIANLPTLHVLKLQQVDFDRNEWEVRDNEFPQLKFLKLENLNLSKWRPSDEAFSCLERLVLHRCLYLKAIPSGFGDIDYLQSIEVKSCNQSVIDSTMEIRETQVDMLQRCGFKVFIQQ
ncbi:hypothetical protein K7X08_023067 [Anisodus acutangulus]|uniref:Disease resistance R13L4/SHOC-2-like LRR domain-containing protein n=1 Tax=Anisodus acutangulus TaxID=402998 RepID=A0A9Q1REU1_9SOLA|nr:hypothetical protein K7X08_023067 [Anisodus acutangulus]